MATQLADKLKKFIIVGISLALGSTWSIINFHEFELVFTENVLLGALAIVLAVQTFALLILWAAFGYTEDELLDKYIFIEEKEVKDVVYKSILIVSFLGLLFGVLFATVLTIQYYLPTFIILNLLSMYGDSIAVRKFSTNFFSISPISKKFTIQESKVRDLIRNYYFHNFYFLRGTIALVGYLFALLIYYSGLEIKFMTHETLAYLITIVTLILNESILWKWRTTRNRAIAEIESQSKQDK